MQNILKLMLWLLMLTTAVPGDVSAQSNMIVEHYTRKDGLPSNVVYGTLKDKDGFVWFGTWHGLCSFDGTDFTSFITRTSPTSDIPPRKVLDMIEDGSGCLWVRNADHHLYLFDKTTETYHDVYKELQRLSRNVLVTNIQSMDNGHVLVLTRNRDVFETYIDSRRKIHIEKIYTSNRSTDASALRTLPNILGENARHVYWLSKGFDFDVMEKKNSSRILPETPPGTVFSCYSRKDGYICTGTTQGDIYIIDIAGRHSRHFRFKGISTPVSSITVMNGKVFFTTTSGLYSFSGNSQPELLTPQAKRIVKAFTDKYNKLWLSTDNGVLICHDASARTTQVFQMPADKSFTETKFIDTGQNGLYILMKSGDVWCFDHTLKVMRNINSIREFSSGGSEPHYFDIDIDKNGILWLASTNSGVYKVGFPRSNFKIQLQQYAGTETNGNGLGIRAVYQDRSGDLWVGNRSGGLFCMDSKTFAVKRMFSKEDIGVVYSIMEDRQGNYWFSTKGSGLVMAEHDALAPQGLRLTRFRNRPGDRTSISSDRVYYSFEDSRGRIWVCTFYGGLNLIQRRNGRTVFFNKRNGFSNYPRYELYSDVRIAAEDKQGRIWVGTTDGLMSFGGSFNKPGDIRFETYRDMHSSGVTTNDISTLYRDHSGRIWLGVFGSGLYLLEHYDWREHRPVLKGYTVSGNQGDVITSITEDGRGCLWISTENGLLSLRQGTSFIRCYDRFAGFPDVSIEDNTSACLRDGRILIGTRQGLLSFSSSAVRNENEERHCTFITAFKADNRNLYEFDPPVYSGSLKYAEEIKLRHDMSTFTIEFASPYYADNSLIQYTYILDGYESQWHNSGTNRIASYANVPPGHYKFRVKVNDGVSPERVLDVTVSPPWWATWWACAVYTLLALLAFYGILRLVLYMIRMRNEVYINNRLAELKLRFFTNVSHELRTPLSLIKGPVEELKAMESLSPSGREYLDLIDRNARKLLQLVNQILDFRKIQNGKMKMHVSYVDMNSIIDMLMRDFSVMAEERDISFTFEKPRERVMAWCDAEKIGIILNNLVTNAFKYTGDGGSICVILGYDHDSRMCTVRVEDNGAGIPKSQLELIFERFSQASNKASDSMASPGSGIGLSLSKEFITMHHGRIWAENLTGESGVAFSIEFPANRENYDEEHVEVYLDDNTAGNDTTADDQTRDEETADGTEEVPAEDKPVIMLIEDNIDMCRMLQLQLSPVYSVFTAHNGEEGLRGIDHHHPDIIITDLMMPGIDGIELLRSVRQDFNISHIPVIVLTAKNSDEDRIRAVKAGANAFITKPFSSSYLMARVNQLLEEQKIFQRKMVVQNTVENDSEGNKDEYGQHLVKKDIEFVRKIHEIIEENLNANDFNIDTIAGTIGLSRSAFFKKLKSLTGFAPVDLVKEIRLNKAAKLIENTDDSITEIAYSVGFRDAGYFGKCFRKKYGKTPKEYRADARGSSDNR